MNTYAQSMTQNPIGYGNTQMQGYNYNSVPSVQEQQMARLQQMEAQRQQNYNMPTTTGQQMAWVSGIEGAKAYIPLPNSRVILMDSDDDFLYMKESDINGRTNLKKFKYKEITEDSYATIDASKYVTIEEFNKVKDEFKTLQSALGIDNEKAGGKVE